MSQEPYHTETQPTSADLQKAIGILRRSLSSMNGQERVQAAGFFVLAGLVLPPRMGGEPFGMVVSDCEQSLTGHHWGHANDDDVSECILCGVTKDWKVPS